MVHMAPWPDERLLSRPKEEDHSSPRSRRHQERGRPRLRGQPLIGQALRQAGPGGPTARPQKTTRLQAQDGRTPQEDLGGGHGRAPRGHPLRTLRVPRKGSRSVGERVDREQGARAPGMEPKKRSLGAGERDEFLRAAWRLLVAGEIGADGLVFVDEMGANVSLSALYAWSRRGQRAFGSAPRNWAKNVTLLASITRRGVGPCLAVEGTTTREVFEAYLERVLAPALFSPGQVVVVMDNLSAHKGGRIKEILEGRGCELIYLPPYSSPDLNPIEQAFSKLKGLLRRAGSRPPAGVIGGLGRALLGGAAPGAPGFLCPPGFPLLGRLVLGNPRRPR